MSASVTARYIAQSETKNHGKFNDVDSKTLKLSAQPHVMARCYFPAAADSLPNGTWTEVKTYTTSLSSAPGVTHVNGTFTVASDGIYLFEFSTAFSAHATGIRGARVRNTSSATLIYAWEQRPAVGDVGVLSSVTVSTVIKLTAGESVIHEAFQSSGGALTVNEGQPGSAMCMKLM